MHPATPQREPTRSGLTDAHGLLAALWPEKESRPSLRWLREQQVRRTVPFIKVGRRVFFDPLQVRRAMEKNFGIEPASLHSNR
ncbi:MAG: hypothetical protein JNM99_16870 [Verrucomicrobiaceae bacterium]|nr:hypothetical protein [Verrucomicrobiaceae bacterium]